MWGGAPSLGLGSPRKKGTCCLSVARMILLQLQLVPEVCGFFKAGSSVLNNISNTKVRGTGSYQAVLSTC